MKGILSLSYHAKKKKKNKDATFDAYSTPMALNEILALRDEPNGPIYIAIVLNIRGDDMTVQYYGTRGTSRQRAFVYAGI